MSVLRMFAGVVLALSACPCCLITSNTAVAAALSGCCAPSKGRQSGEQQPDGSKAPTKTAVSAALAQNASPPDGQRAPREPGRVTAKLIVLQATDASDDDLRKMAAGIEVMKDVIRAAIDTPTKCISILATADSAVTAERAMSFLDLAGYAATEADEDAYANAEAALRSAVIEVPVSIAGACGTISPGTPARSGGVLTSLAESVEPLRRAFNTNKGEYRFVALLSPT